MLVLGVLLLLVTLTPSVAAFLTIFGVTGTLLLKRVREPAKPS